MMVFTLIPGTALAEGTSGSVTSVNIVFNAILDDGSGGAELITGERLNVTDGLAEQYGYTIPETDHNGVSIDDPVYLDALVAAHIAKYGDSFTRDTAQNYLGLTSAGYLSKAFGKNFDYGVILTNGTSSSDGIKLAGSATGYIVTTTRIFEGDVLCAMNGPGYGMEYNTFFDKTKLTAAKNETISLTLEGNQPVMVMWGQPNASKVVPIYGDEDGEPFTVTYGYYALDGIEPTTLQYFDDPVTGNENGTFSFSFSESGEYLVVSEVYDSTGIQAVSPYCYITVENSSTLSDAGKAQNAAEAISWDTIRGENDSDCIMNVKKKLSLDNGAVWESSAPEIISATGEINAEKVNGKAELVTLTATVTCGTETAKKSITVMVRKPADSQKYEISAMADGINSFFCSNTSKISDWWTVVGMQQYLKSDPTTPLHIYDRQKQQLVDSAIETITNTTIGNSGGYEESSAVSAIATSIIMLESLGYNAEDIISLNKTEVNAVEKLSKADFAKAQEYVYYSTVAPYVTLALGTGGTKYNNAIQKNVDYLVALCEEKQTNWGYESGGTFYADLDTPTMILQGLAPNYDTNERVKAVVDKIVSWLSEKQDADTASFGNISTNSMAAIALSSLGIDVTSDARFIKNGKTLVDAFSASYTQGSNYQYTFGDDFSNKQGLVALTTMQNVAASQVAYNPFDFSSTAVNQAVASSKGTATEPTTPETDKNINVTVTIRGDAGIWTIQNVTVKEDSTVYHAFIAACEKAGFSQIGAATGYVSSITNTTTGKTLAHFDKGPNSGWLYKVNNVLPDVGLTSYQIKDGDRILWYYTDDWTKDPDAGKYMDTTTNQAVTTTGASGSATTTTPTEVTVSGDTAKATVTTENASEAIKQAQENKSSEIVLNVTSTDIKNAEKIQVDIPTSTAKEILNTTTADLTVETPAGSVTVPQDALKETVSESKGTTITIEITKVSKPTEIQKKAAGESGHIITVTIKSGDKVISTFGGKSLKLKAEIPTALKGKNIVAIHIAADGTVEKLSGKLVKEGTKEFYEFVTNHLSTFAIVDADELGLEVSDEEADIEKIKELVSDMSLKARSSKTSRKNIKVALTVDNDTAAAIKEIKEMGYTVKYKYYRSTKKSAKYQTKITKTTKSYINTSGTKGTKYYYKARVQVYDKDGKLVAQTALKQCKYAARKWTK